MTISEFDCRPAPKVQSESLPAPEIDYLAKDFASFRRLMLDRMAAILPDWQERSPADLGVALVEVLAYAADQLSYYQDTVATEAYLGTARQRISVKRHARLLDYAVHEGCNARVWIQIQVHAQVDEDEEEPVDEGVPLAQGTPLLTQAEEPGVIVRQDSSEFFEALANGALVFETMHPAQLFAAHNEIIFYTGAHPEFALLAGATGCTLVDEWISEQGSERPRKLRHLRAGDILIFEEMISPKTGVAADADPMRRHAVRLVNVTFSEESQMLGAAAVPVVKVEWGAQDALPFDLHISRRVAGKLISNMSVARGNVVLADHGRTLAGEALPPAPEGGRYRPRLGRADLTYSTPYSESSIQSRPASAALIQDPRAALPAIALQIGNEAWTARRDLLNSDRFARDFVVEMDNAGGAHLRFGDGARGRRPAGGSIPSATYRSGNGIQGNIGRETIARLVLADEQLASRIKCVHNPLPARGGVRPESLEQVRLHAPQAYRAQERCVTALDYAQAAQRHPEVDRATAALQWTGGWHTMFVSVERKGDRAVDAAFAAELRAFLERFRLAGYDLEISPPCFVPLDIALRGYVAPRSFRVTINQALLETFSDVDLPDGRRGFFHPNNFTFGEAVYLSQIVEAAMRVPGVDRVETVRFQPWGQPSRGEGEAGRIKIGPLEIARLDNDPGAPENGRIEFDLRGGS